MSLHTSTHCSVTFSAVCVAPAAAHPHVATTVAHTVPGLEAAGMLNLELSSGSGEIETSKPPEGRDGLVVAAAPLTVIAVTFTDVGFQQGGVSGVTLEGGALITMS